ncbi:TPA: response regulator [Legionella pneumophila]|uniref:Response regulator receiver n=1 Tax=Legionella jordanis TaxID=456 RepID=A0A0W0V9Q3_9GAMM|nr:MULTISPECIES: response regulator [Legionella]KTD16826.1 Response regulator receiver [Legionella jordanis]MCK1847903.1 response regulator [Legionella pneumophila]VEH11705.1 Response regulator receiver [Legionella jordanis]
MFNRVGTMRYSFYFLVAEESFPNRIIIRNQLMQLGQKVDIVATPEDLLSQVAVNSYDILLIDVGLYNKLYGCDLMGFIKKKQPYSITPIVALTFLRSPRLEKCNITKEWCFFCKPLNPQEAQKIINYIESTLN